MLDPFLNLVSILLAFISSTIVPASAGDVTLLHVAIWVPVVVGLVAGTWNLIRRQARRPKNETPKATTKGATKAQTRSRKNVDDRPFEKLPEKEKQRRYKKALAEVKQNTPRQLAQVEKLERQRRAAERKAQAQAKKAERAAAVEARRVEREQRAADRAALAEARRIVREQKAAERASRPPSKRRRPRPPGDSLTRAFGADPRQVYEFRHKIVDLDSLVTSNTDSGAVNPAYDKQLQPRMRDRAASEQQIERLARGLVPESIIWDFHQLDKGAPIAGSDHQVESGNGRILALRKAREIAPDRYSAYQEKLRENLAAVGLDESALDGVANPVLIRERVSEVDRAGFAREANAPPVLQMSTLELALVDARRLSDAMLLRLAVRDEQSIDQALRAAGNRQFVRDFAETLSENERAVLMRKNGTLSQMGIWRIKGALFARVFPGEAGTRIADTFLESLDSTTKNYENAISKTLPALVRAESLISSGQRDSSLSIAEDVSKSLDVLARLRENDVIVKNYVGQSSMFDRELTPAQERLLVYFDEIGRSEKQIREFFHRYAAAVEQSPDPNQGDLFGPVERSRDDFIDSLIQSREPQQQRLAA